VLDSESDVMLSSGSVLMSSAGDSDDVMGETWTPQQQQQPDTDTSSHTLPPSLNYCPLDTGNNSETVCGNNNRPDDDVSKANENTHSATAACDPVTGSWTPPATDSDASDLGSHSQATSVKYEPTAEDSIKTPIDANEQIDISVAAENVSEQNSPELAENEDDQSAAKEQVSTSASVEEPQLSTSDAAKTDVDLQALNGIQNTMSAESVKIEMPSVDVDSCQLSSQLQSVEPPPQRLTEPSTDRSKLSSETVQDSVADMDVRMKTRKHDRKNIKEQTNVSRQPIQSKTDKTLWKKETGSSAKDKVDGAASSRTAANPRATRAAGVSATSKEPLSRRSVDTAQTGDMNTTDKSKRKRDDDTSQTDIDNKTSVKSASTQKASDRTATASSAAVAHSDATERSSSRIKNGKTVTTANRETENTPDSAESKNPSSTAAAKRITGRKTESLNAEDRKNRVGDKVSETTSKLLSNNPTGSNQESTNQTKSLGSDVRRNPGKGTSASARQSFVARINPKPEDEDKDAETRREETTTSNGKQRKKSTGSDLTNPQSIGSTASADNRPAEKLSENSSSSGNPGNPKTVGDRATTADQSKATTKKQAAPQRTAGSRVTVKPSTTTLPCKGASQTARTTQRADKPSNMATAVAGDSKTPKTSSK